MHVLEYWAIQRSWFARMNALCNLSRKKSREVAAHFRGRFLSRRCFTQCITVEVEPRIAKQYKCQYCCKNYHGKGMEGGKQVSLFFGWPEDSEFIEKMRFGASYSSSNKLLPDTLWLRASKNAFKVGTVNFANSLSPLSIVKEVCAGSKSSHRI